MATNDRADLRQRARVRADQDSSGFPTDAQYNVFLDECGRTVYGDLVDAGFPFDESSSSISIGFAAATHIINSGAPVQAITRVVRVEGSQETALKLLPRELEAHYRSQSGPATHYLPRQSITQGPGVSLFPSPSGGDYRVGFLVPWTGFVDDADLWRGPYRSDELIVLMAAAKGCRKEGEVSDANALMEEYRELWPRVMAAVGSFNQQDRPVIQDRMSNELGDQLAMLDPFSFSVRPA